MDRSMLYERYLDDLELYFNYKRDLNKRVKALWEKEHKEALGLLSDPTEVFWQEYETLDTLRELSMRAFDEYILMIDREQGLE